MLGYLAGLILISDMLDGFLFFHNFACEIIVFT